MSITSVGKAAGGMVVGAMGHLDGGPGRSGAAGVLERRSRLARSCALLVLLALGACSGDITSGPPMGTGGTGTGGTGGGMTGGAGGTIEPPPLPGPDPNLKCDPARPPVATDMRRLSKYEYVNTLTDLLGAPAVGSLSGVIALVPADRNSTRLDTVSQDITSSHVKGYYQVAEAIGSYYFERAPARAALHPCLSTFQDPNCIQQFVTTFGARVFRRPVTPAEATNLADLAQKGGGKESGLALVLTAMFQAPDFIFKMEVGGAQGPDGSGKFPLSDGEVANRLAYYLTGTMPDAELLAAAASGQLRTDAQVEAQARRLLGKDGARAHMKHFSEQWLLLDASKDVENIPPHIRGATGVNNLNAAMNAEIEQVVDYVIWQKRGNFADLMTTPVTFAAPTPILAAIYGVTSPSASTPIEVPGGKRNGLLTRLRFTARSNGEPHPLQRGAFVRNELLCGHLMLPDANTLPPDTFEDPPYDPRLTTRQRFERKTTGPLCTGCHSLINPLGFAMEDIDALGRFRTVETIYDQTSNKPVAMLPINSTVDPTITEAGKGSVTGAAELGRAIAGHPQGSWCMASHWFEYAMARRGKDAEDACVIDGLSKTLTQAGGGVAEMALRMTAMPEFRWKRNPAQ